MNSENKQYFRLFSNCIPVSGAKNYLICDLYLNRYIYIPEFIYFVFTSLKEMSIVEINNYFMDNVEKEFNEFLEFLHINDWGFFTNEPSAFPELSNDFEIPFAFNNAILDLDENSKYDYVRAITKLDEAGCQAIQIRCFSYFDSKHFIHLLKALHTSGLKYIEILIRNEIFRNTNEYKALFKENVRLRKVFLFNQKSTEVINVEDDVIDYGKLYKLTQDLVDETFCGSINKMNFVSNISFYIESKYFNNCLNKKISVDKYGLIKNCPSMKFDFGNIDDIELTRLSASPSFNRFNSINKDLIDVCRDCEFRYMCTDCRAYTKDPNNPYSKPLKCSYDPYTGIWG